MTALARPAASSSIVPALVIEAGERAQSRS